MAGQVTSLNFAPVKRSELPTTRNSDPAIRVREQGSIALNAAACSLLGVTFTDGQPLKLKGHIQTADAGNGAVAILVALGEGPKGTPETDLFKFSKGKKSAELSASAAGLFQKATTYEYKASGTQSFKVSEFALDVNYQPNPKGKIKALAFTVPSGGLTPPPKRPRKPKAVEVEGEGQAATVTAADVQTAPPPNMDSE